MLAPDDAWAVLASDLTPLEPIDAPLLEALGAYAAEPISAPTDLPPTDRAAMDGYAFRFDDGAARGERLTVAGEVAAGQAAASPVQAGQCVRIYTGAPLPDGADTVIAVEQTSTGDFRSTTEDHEIALLKIPGRGANVFRRGTVARAGETLIPAGQRLGPRQLALAAAAGRASLRVHRRPRVRILNTGSELLEAADLGTPFQIPNSNGPLLATALREAGLGVPGYTVVPDAPQALIDALRLALDQADALIVTGGISAGRRDYVPQALEALGARIRFRGVAMKPGKPQLFARAPSGQPIFGLPGNPLSCIVGLYELILPALRRLAGAPIEHCRPLQFVPLAGPVTHHGDRWLMQPARLERDASGTRAVPLISNGSADVATGARADGALIVHPGAGALAAGTWMPFRPWGCDAP